MRFKFIYILLIQLYYLHPMIGQASFELQGSWQNELGSVLIIDSVGANQRIYGVYKSSTGVDGRIFPLLGWVNQDESTGRIAIAFSVRWEGYGSITSWTGYLDRDQNGEYMKVLWHLIRPQPELSWERIISNSSTFRKSVD